jgi:NAD(P)H-nitrite reductase large subunit
VDQRKPTEAVLKQTNGTFAVIPATPAGVVTGDQLAKIAELVREGAGIAKFTTGQRIVILTSSDKVQSVKDGLKEVGLEVGPVGATIRNVKGCAGRLCKYHCQDALGDAMELDKLVAGRVMPAPLKVSLSGCRKNCLEARSNDIGFIGLPNGYQVYVGGKGGRQMLGQLVREEVKSEDLPAVLEDILAKYLEVARTRERVSRVVELHGLDRFK